MRILVKKDDTLDGVTSGVPCKDRDSGTVAAPAAALEGVWASNAELRFSLTDRYRGGLERRWHLHCSNLLERMDRFNGQLL